MRVTKKVPVSNQQPQPAAPRLNRPSTRRTGQIQTVTFTDQTERPQGLAVKNRSREDEDNVAVARSQSPAKAT